MDDEDEVQEITDPRNAMKNNKVVYVTCNQTIAMKFKKKTYPLLVKLLWQNVQKLK